MKTLKISLGYGALLAFVALLCTAISTGIYFLTKPQIDAAMQRQQRELLLQVVPQTYFDNDLGASCHLTKKAILQQAQIIKICTAKKADNITAYAFESVAHDGYSGDIRILVGITPQGEVLGVRVIEHHETPGLGDKIEARISDWILGFAGQKISENNQSEWAVKKDGGKFDQFAGATITPRAVVNQVKRGALSLLAEENLQEY